MINYKDWRIVRLRLLPFVTSILHTKNAWFAFSVIMKILISDINFSIIDLKRDRDLKNQGKVSKIKSKERFQ